MCLSFSGNRVRKHRERTQAGSILKDLLKDRKETLDCETALFKALGSIPVKGKETSNKDTLGRQE